jgi:hypothetical protein
MIYDERSKSPMKFLICKMKAGMKRRLQMKASFDKNKSQRIRDFSCKIALFCQP